MTYKPEVKQGSSLGLSTPTLSLLCSARKPKWAAVARTWTGTPLGTTRPTLKFRVATRLSTCCARQDHGAFGFVTPLTLRSSVALEVFVAYSVTYADEVQVGSLNELSIYVLGHNDPRLVNIDQLSAEANDWMAKNAGMFRANQGKLIEFTPIDGDVWRVFGELGGQVVYQLDISASRKIAPVLVSVGAYGDSPTPSQQPGSTAGQSVCGDNIAALDNSALAGVLARGDWRNPVAPADRRQVTPCFNLHQ